MTILLPALAVAYGAVCIWLIVRFINRREEWAIWTLGLIYGVPALFLIIAAAVWWYTIPPVMF